MAPAPGLEPGGINGKVRQGGEGSGKDRNGEASDPWEIGHGAAELAARQREGERGARELPLLDAALAEAALDVALRGMADRIAATLPPTVAR